MTGFFSLLIFFAQASFATESAIEFAEEADCYIALAAAERILRDTSLDKEDSDFGHVCMTLVSASKKFNFVGECAMRLDLEFDLVDDAEKICEGI